jgi:hypothetical protein
MLAANIFVFVKVFGCRPMTVVRHTPGAGVRKPPREETAVVRGRRGGRYGELSAVAGQQPDRARVFWRLACTDEAPASSVTGSMGEDWRARTGGDAMWLRAPSWPVENQLRGRAAFQRGGLGVEVMRYRS